MSTIYDSVVITGGGGMLGHALANALAARGVNAVSLTRAQCDISTSQGIAQIFSHRPTLLLNCAAHTKVDACEAEEQKAAAINGHAVGELAKRSKEHGTFLVHVSTDFVFDGQGSAGRPYRVNDAVAPLSAYGRSKLLGENQLKAHAPKDWLIIRTAWVYGRHGANFPRTMVTVARAGKPLSVVEDQVGSPTYTVDLAAAILHLVDARANGTFHLTNSGQTNWREFAQAALKAFNIDHPVAGLTSADWQKIKPNAAPRPRYSVLDLSEFQQKTGKQMRPWREALHDFAQEVDRAGF